MRFNIIDFGAVPDGRTDATGAIQQAIDQCCANGGGRVVIPAGTFACDTVKLKDNIEFHMEQGSGINGLLKPVNPSALPEINGEVIFPIGMNGGVPYFMPPVGFDEAGNLARLISINDANADEIGKIPPELMPPKSHINASFIYAHPPDYHGIPMLNASVGAWQKVFRRFREMRIDTVIFQAALWRELGECFYRSKRFAGMTCYGVLERMFAAAEEEHMRVFLGGYGSVAGWKEHFTEAELAAELECHRSCFEELYRLGKISGMYFPAETAFDGRRLPEKEQRMRTLYRKFSDMVKSRDSSLKILASPATMHTPDKNDMFKDYWNSVLESSHIDILLPQDCIGNTCSRLSDMTEQWKAWKEVADSHKIDLWSHIEIFERRGYCPECDVYPAPPERVATQLALTAPYVSGYCCWEALYFASDEAGTEGKRLRQFLDCVVMRF